MTAGPTPAQRSSASDAVREPLVGGVAFIAVLAGLMAILRPWQGSPVGSDIGATIVYAQRIAAGIRLEAFLGSTPKPLLSVMDGGLFALTKDWRVIGALGILALAIGVAAWAVTVFRLSGSLGGAAFAVVSLSLASGLFLDVALAYTVTWLVLWLGIAALAMTAARPRWALAGLALGAAALCRQEALILPAVAMAGLVVSRLAGDRWPALRAGPGAAWILVAWLAVPLSGLHDWLLTGDPLYSVAVSGIVSAERNPPGLSAALAILGRHLAAAPLALVLAAVGIVALLRMRRLALACGLLAMAGGIATFILLLGVRHIVILDRYATPIDAAVLIAAAFGVAELLRLGAAALARGRGAPDDGRTGGAVAVGALAVGVLAALVAMPGIGPLDPAVTTLISGDRAALVAFEDARPQLEAATATLPGLRTWPSVAQPRVYPSGPGVLLVSSRLMTMALADLNLPATTTLRLSPALGADGTPAVAGSAIPAPGQVVYFDPRVDKSSAFDWLEVTGTATANGVVLTRLEPPSGDARLLVVAAP